MKKTPNKETATEENDGEENCIVCDKKLGKKGGCGGTGLCAQCCLGEADVDEGDY